jgi:hypothetical protein
MPRREPSNLPVRMQIGPTKLHLLNGGRFNAGCCSMRSCPNCVAGHRPMDSEFEISEGSRGSTVLLGRDVFETFTLGVASMDAASLFEALRSVGLLAIFLTNAVMMDEPQTCPQQCKTRCESCQASDQPATAVSASKAESQEHEGACPACPGTMVILSDGADADVSEEGCRECVKSIAVTVAHAKDCADCCDEVSSCPGSQCTVGSPSPNHPVVVRVVAHATTESERTCPFFSDVHTKCPLSTATVSCSASEPTIAEPTVSAGKTSCSSCVSTRTVQISRVAHAATADCVDDCEMDGACPCPSECGDCPSEALVSVCDDEVRGAAVVGHWVSDLVSGKPKFKATFAVHGVVPEMNWTPVEECGHKKICAGDRCYEVEDVAIEGQTCDQTEANAVEFQQPIHCVPAAPPLPPSYQFTQMPQGGFPVPAGASPWGIPVSVQADPINAALAGTTVSVPANVLTRLLVEQATASTRLEMTQGLMEEREAYMSQYLQVVERNMTLQSQLAAMEARQQYSDALAATLADRMDAALKVAHRSQETVQSDSSSAEQRSEIDTIQEDLTNIRRQIALLKRQSPVPFAPSFMGAHTGDASVPTRSAKGTFPTRSAKGGVYVPVTPTAAPCASASCPDSPASEIGLR